MKAHTDTHTHTSIKKSAVSWKTGITEQAAEV